MFAIGRTSSSLLQTKRRSNIGVLRRRWCPPWNKRGNATEHRRTGIVGSTSEQAAAVQVTPTDITVAPYLVPLATAFAAAALGILNVSLVAAVTDELSACPPYSPTSQRFSSTHFAGRLARMLLQCDPRLLLYSDAQVLHAKHMLDHYQNYVGQDRELWKARCLVESALNDKGEFVPRPFRMSGYVLFNGPVKIAMLASHSTKLLLFWSWANQSQNALVNYFNRGGVTTTSNNNSSTNSNNNDHAISTTAMTTTTIFKSYAAAVGAALTIVVGLAAIIRKRYPAPQAKAYMRWVAFPSAVVASSLNCYIMRSPEMITGVPLVNAAGENVVLLENNDNDNGASGVATSQLAAAQGVYATAFTRGLLPAVVFLPPLLLTVGPIQRYLIQKPAMTVPMTAYVLMTSYGIGLPATVAIFPQMRSIPADAVEERFQNLIDPETQQPYKVFYYNKGL